MKFFVHSETSRTTVRERLGLPEYSYHFVREKFLPVLRRIGEVVEFEELDTEFPEVLGSAAARAGGGALFFFGPPHRAPRISVLPTVCVFAWEYPTIPDETWDDNPFNDWRVPLKRFGHAITLSGLAADALRRALPGDVHVEVIPAPISHPPGLKAWWELVRKAHAVKGQNRLDFAGRVYDSRAYRISHDFVQPLEDPGRAGRAPWTGERLEWSFANDDNSAALALVGFYSPDNWGSWSRTGSPWITLPWRVESACRLTVQIVGAGPNAGAEIGIEMGGDYRVVRLDSVLGFHELVFTPQSGADSIRFSGITPIAGGFSASDPRSIGMGIASLRLESLDGDESQQHTVSGITREPVAASLTLDGVVYTSIFNPEDGRKNWEDMVTAFCWALRDREDATLVLKMSHHNPATFHGRLMGLWSALHPFRCRIVAIHGYLDQEQYDLLVDASSYVVNSSRCEGQCLPLMEFMRRGVPAIAPDHTAMRDYLDGSNAFVVASWQIPECWPQDPRRAFRTRSNRIDWDSLRAAFVRAHAVATRQGLRYRLMSIAAARRIAGRFSERQVEAALRQFVEELSREG